MGGVLIDYDPKKTVFAEFGKENGDILLREVFLSGDWRMMDKGLITGAELVDAKKDRIPPETFERVREMVSNFFPYMKQFDDIVPLIDKLKANGYRILLLSNSSSNFHENRGLYPVLDKFDGLFISADYKLLKPDREIYEKFFEVTGAKAEECFFIDDMPANVEGGKACGMRGHVYKHGEMDKLTKDMRDNGIRI